MTDPQETHPLQGFRREEAYAAWVIEYVLNARVEPRDIPGAPRGTVDGEIIYPDGHTAALEITGVEPTADRHLRARIDKLKPSAAPGKLMWTLRPNSVAELERLQEIHVRVIELCEGHGVREPEQLPLEVIAHDPDLIWLAWEGFLGRMSGHPVEGIPRVWWMYPITSAVFSSEADEIAAGVAAALMVEPSLGHVAKLLRDAHEERHLFLIVGSTGLSNAAAFALIEPDTVPAVDPALPDGLDHLWLGPGWGSTVTRWTRGVGWRNERVSDLPAMHNRRR